MSRWTEWKEEWTPSTVPPAWSEIAGVLWRRFGRFQFPYESCLAWMENVLCKGDHPGRSLLKCWVMADAFDAVRKSGSCQLTDSDLAQAIAGAFDGWEINRIRIPYPALSDDDFKQICFELDSARERLPRI